MQWLTRDDFGAFLNDAGLAGAGAEVGSGAGTFAAAVLRRWGGRELTLIDCWEPQSPTVYVDSANVGREEHAANERLARELAARDPRASVQKEFSLAAAAGFAPASLDFVYLDANHAYRSCCADLMAWWPTVRPGGFLAGHDYLDGLHGGTMFGVKSAVDEFAARVGRAVAFTTADKPWPSWYLRKPVGRFPPPDRITLLTAYDRSLSSIGAISRANKEPYCRRHGYRFVCRTSGFDESRPAAWSKILFTLQALTEAAWVFWTDADSLIMNSSIPLEHFLHDSVDLILSSDPYNGINTGCYFVRNSEWGRNFLRRVYGQTAFLHHRWWENAAMLDLYGNDADVRRHVAVVPNKLFNAYPYEGGGFSVGDFIVHFPGMDQRDGVMNDYAARAEGATQADARLRTGEQAVRALGSVASGRENVSERS